MQAFARLVKIGVQLEQFWVSETGCLRHKAVSGILEDPIEDESSVEAWQWPKSCETCGELAPKHAFKKINRNSKLYSTKTGQLEPGCFYWVDTLPENYFWDNHRGPHLAVVAPNGFKWVIDSRANNCRRPNDRHHRCWPWTGDPECGTVSIDSELSCMQNNIFRLGNWTGSLVNGKFIPKTTY